MRRCAFVALVVLTASYGVWATAIPEAAETGATFLICAIVPGLLTGTWCLFDGRVRGKAPPEAGLLGLVLVPMVGFPIYCAWSRGLRGVLFCLGYAAILLLALIVGMAVSFLMCVPPPG
jgi:hypothetical protein